MTNDTHPMDGSARGLRLGGCRARLRSGTSRFVRDEAGSMSIMMLFTALSLVAIGGIGIDLMASEHKRNKIQSSLDQAVLAAADLEQVLDPTLVVTDYLQKMELADAMTGVTADTGLNYKVVSASASVDTPSNFTRFLGVESLRASGESMAEERIANVEISLVLDISGSMDDGNKMAELQGAASTFVDTVLDQDIDDLVSISLVPYSEQVNAGPLLTKHFNVDWMHGYSHCLEVDDDQFDSTSFDMTATYTQMQHFQWNYPGWNSLTDTVCPRYDYERILPFSQNASALKKQINKFEPRAGTSIFLGMKWATALLDPAHRDIVGGLIDDRAVDSAFAPRPAEWNDPNTLKTIVLMTDGQHDRSYRIQNWAYNSASEVSQWSRYNFWHYLANNVNWRDRGYFYYQKYNADQGDMLLDRICDAAKAQNIVIWGIGFEVSDHGAEVMRNCASSPAHFFRVEGVEIDEAFFAIARSINQLRLIQ